MPAPDTSSAPFAARYSPRPTTEASPVLAFVGGGPKTTEILLALAAQARAKPEDFPSDLRIHVIDPFPPGGGRIWRQDQSPTLWMNSTARDITAFADPDATLGPQGSAGAPPVTGPSLAEWIRGEGASALERLGLSETAAGIGPFDFAPRRVQAAYMSWVFDRMRAALPSHVRLQVHRAKVLDLRPTNGSDGEQRHRLVLDEGAEIVADAVLVAQGHVEMSEDSETREYREALARQGLDFVAPGYTADLDLTRIPAGAHVLVRGFGLAFVDAMMMLTEDRGGTYVREETGRIRYEPSGREPVLWVGSRRGIPYLPKLGYVAEGLGLSRPRYLNHERAESMAAASEDGVLDAGGVLLPLLEPEMAAAHYEELARHPERTGADAQDFFAVLDDWAAAIERRDADAVDAARERLRTLEEHEVPDLRDRFDLQRISDPYAQASFGSREEFDRDLARKIAGDLERAADPRFSQDSAVFFALVSAYFAVREMVARGLVRGEDRASNVDGRMHGLFSFIASGPPPERLENLLALHEAGLVRFLGPRMDVRLETRDRDERTPEDEGPGRLTATSSAHPDPVSGDVFLEARLATISAPRVKDRMLQSMMARGVLQVERAPGTAKFLTDATGRALDAEGTPHPGVFLVGPSVAGSVQEAFARPGTNAHLFRDNARLAREILESLRR